MQADTTIVQRQPNDPALVDEHAAARYLNISVTTLRRDRSRPSKSIPVINIGSTVRYSLRALDHWIERNMMQADGSLSKDAPGTHAHLRRRGRPRRQPV